VKKSVAGAPQTGADARRSTVLKFGGRMSDQGLRSAGSRIRVRDVEEVCRVFKFHLFDCAQGKWGQGSGTLDRIPRSMQLLNPTLAQSTR
jgi:hypothetical protein